MNDTNLHILSLVVGPLLAFISSLAVMWGKSSYDRGWKERTAVGLSEEFQHFKDGTFDKFQNEMRELVKEIFAKIDRVSENIGKYPCQQLGMISAMDTQIRANTLRIDRVQKQMGEIEIYLIQRGHGRIFSPPNTQDSGEEDKT
jgi:hypothetical protein